MRGFWLGLGIAALGYAPAFAQSVVIETPPAPPPPGAVLVVPPADARDDACRAMQRDAHMAQRESLADLRDAQRDADSALTRREAREADRALDRAEQRAADAETQARMARRAC